MADSDDVLKAIIDKITIRQPIQSVAAQYAWVRSQSAFRDNVEVRSAVAEFMRGSYLRCRDVDTAIMYHCAIRILVHNVTGYPAAISPSTERTRARFDKQCNAFYRGYKDFIRQCAYKARSTMSPLIEEAAKVIERLVYFDKRTGAYNVFETDANFVSLYRYLAKVRGDELLSGVGEGDKSSALHEELCDTITMRMQSMTNAFLCFRLVSARRLLHPYIRSVINERAEARAKVIKASPELRTPQSQLKPYLVSFLRDVPMRNPNPPKRKPRKYLSNDSGDRFAFNLEELANWLKTKRSMTEHDVAFLISNIRYEDWLKPARCRQRVLNRLVDRAKPVYLPTLSCCRHLCEELQLSPIYLQTAERFTFVNDAR